MRLSPRPRGDASLWGFLARPSVRPSVRPIFLLSAGLSGRKQRPPPSVRPKKVMASILPSRQPPSLLAVTACTNTAFFTHPRDQLRVHKFCNKYCDISNSLKELGVRSALSYKSSITYVHYATGTRLQHGVYSPRCDQKSELYISLV